VIAPVDNAQPGEARDLSLGVEDEEEGRDHCLHVEQQQHPHRGVVRDTIVTIDLLHPAKTALVHTAYLSKHLK
jgi:hypothetical protein